MEAPDDPAFPHRIGRVLRPHGLRGEITVQLFRPRRIGPEHLKTRRVKRAEPVEFELEDESFETHGVVAARFLDPSRVAVLLEGVDDRDAAERFSGAFFDIDPARAPSLVADEADRLFGARAVEAESRRPLGRITEIRDNGAQPILVIGGPGEGGEAAEGRAEIMIPMVEAFVGAPEATPEGLVVPIHPIPGLLDLE